MPNFIIIQGSNKWIIPLVITLISIVISLVFIEPLRKRIRGMNYFIKENMEQKDNVENTTKNKKNNVEYTADNTTDDTADNTTEDTADNTTEDTADDNVDDTADDTADNTADDNVEDTTEDTTEKTIEDTSQDNKKDTMEESFISGIFVKDNAKNKIQGYNYDDYNTQYKSCVEMQKVSTKKRTQCESSLNKKIQEYEKMNVMYNYEPELLEKPKTSYYNGIGNSNKSLFSN